MIQKVVNRWMIPLVYFGKWEMGNDIISCCVSLDFKDMTFDKWFDMIINIIKTIQMEYERRISQRGQGTLYQLDIARVGKGFNGISV